jgi:hypothetical protein
LSGPHVAPLGWEHIALTGDYIWRARDLSHDRVRGDRRRPTSSLGWSSDFLLVRAKSAHRKDFENLTGTLETFVTLNAIQRATRRIATA